MWTWSQNWVDSLFLMTQKKFSCAQIFMAMKMNLEFMWLISKSQALGCLCIREWLRGTELTACANWFMLVGWVASHSERICRQELWRAQLPNKEPAKEGNSFLGGDLWALTLDSAWNCQWLNPSSSKLSEEVCVIEEMVKSCHTDEQRWNRKQSRDILVTPGSRSIFAQVAIELYEPTHSSAKLGQIGLFLY